MSSAVRCCFLDFSSAFNTIRRQGVLDSISSFGLPNWSLQWMKDYFTSRKQYIVTGGKKSVCLPNDRGVLQSVVLLPFLFASYLDQLTSNDVRILKYADDITPCHPEKSAADTEVLLRSLNDLKTWCVEHGLVLNASECRQIVFFLRPIYKPRGFPHWIWNYHHVQIALGDLLGKCNLVGTYWNRVPKRMRLCYFTRRLRCFGLPQLFIVRFVLSAVLPIILYCSPAISPGLLSHDWYCFDVSFSFCRTPLLFCMMSWRTHWSKGISANAICYRLALWKIQINLGMTFCFRRTACVQLGNVFECLYAFFCVCCKLWPCALIKPNFIHPSIAYHISETFEFYTMTNAVVGPPQECFDRTSGSCGISDQTVRDFPISPRGSQ